MIESAKGRGTRGRVLAACLAASLAITLALACQQTRVELSEVIDSPGDLTNLYARSRLSSDDGFGKTAAPRTEKLLRAELSMDADACRSRIEEAQETPPLPGAPAFQEKRALLLARAKAEPVLFVETPHFVGTVSRGTQARRRVLEQGRFPRDAVQETLSTFRDFPERLRELLLRDGYLYTDDPRAANLLTTELTLERLFRGPSLQMLRGSTRLLIEKGEGGVYYFASGPDRGERARLLLFDRVWISGQEPGPPLHVDVRELTAREGIEGMRVAHIGTHSLVAEVRFGDEWVPALIEREGVDLKMGCYLVEPGEAARVGRARDEAYRRTLVLDALRRAIAEQVRLGLPFDEPKTEHGQQDGKLRARWERAYFQNKESYKFNGDKYSVYNSRGAPMTPQVCIDFVTETFERASGMLFASKSERPEKVLGALNFDELLEGRRRQELAIRDYARINPHRLSLIDYPLGEWVRYEKIGKFFAFIEREKDEMRPGDIVVIRGRAAWDRYREVHTHTFFIYESDPMTGMPTLLTGNSGKPRISTWDGEMLRAPRRSIRHRIRPNMEWLYDHVVLRTPLRGESWAAPLALSER